MLHTAVAALAEGTVDLPRFTATSLFSEWSLEPVSFVLTVWVAGLYLWGTAVLRRRGDHWPIGRTLAFVGLGMGLFGLKLTGSWWAALPLLVLGAFAFQSIGLVVGAVSKTEEAASGFANLVILPMAFLSGSFIPLDAAPGWIRTVANYLPMGHLNKGMSAVMVRGEGPGAIVLPALVLIGFTVVFSLLAARLFRWED